MTAQHTDRDPLDELAEEFVARYRRGEKPALSEYAQRYPHLADDIRELFPAALLMEDLKAPPGPAPADVPEQLGDFRVLREIGRGGMGVVYEAEQLSLGRRVALKILAQAHLGAQMLERFDREARAAGRLHHTNIVPVFGTGVQGGLHYYVMQYIDGEGLDCLLARLRGQQRSSPKSTNPAAGLAYRADRTDAVTGIPTPTNGDATLLWKPEGEVSVNETPSAPTRFSDTNHFRDMARLAAQAADALAHAHGKGILHRDIKPANLLLDKQGTLWVTDFGLAKLLEQDDLTRPGEVAGTLRYSAPERFAGRSDARSDIYSLGLTLYEMLTLRPAYAEDDPGKLLYQVTHGRITSPRALVPALPRDLETIVLKCLALEPERRYASAADLTDDLQRFLADRPIKARRIGPLERGWRWCRRNPAIAMLSAALPLVFLAGFVGVVWKWREASNNFVRSIESEGREAVERHRAEANLSLALKAFDQIAKKLVSGRPGVPLDASDEAPHSPLVTPEAAAILETLVGFHQQFADTNSNDPRLQRDTARALRQAGTIRLRLGDATRAVESLTKAAELLANIPDQKLELAQTYNDLGVVLRAANKTADAVRAHTKAQEILRALPEGDTRARLELARTYHLLGAIEWRLRRLPAAEAHLRDALQILAALMEKDKSNRECRHLSARAHHDLAQMLVGPARQPEANRLHDLAIQMQEQLCADYPGVPDFRAEIVEMLMTPPGLFAKVKMLPDSEPRLTRAVELASDLVVKYPSVPDYQALLARAKMRLAQSLVQSDRKRTDEAVAHLKAAVKLYADLGARSPGALAPRVRFADPKLLLGEIHRRRGELDESARVLNEVIEEVQKGSGLSPRNRFERGKLILAYRSLAQTRQDQGKPDEAKRLQKLADELASKG